MPRDAEHALDAGSPVANGSVAEEERLSSGIKKEHSELHSTLDQFRNTQQKSAEDLQTISSLYEKIRQETACEDESESPPMAKLSNYHRSKLKTIYNNVCKDLNAEAQQLRACLSHVHQIRRLREEKRRLLLRKHQQMRGQSATADDGNAHSHSHNKNQPAPPVGGYGLRRGALMLLLQKAAATLPLWIDNSQGEEGQPPPLCGAIPAELDHTCQPGDMVAVRAKVQDDGENWILAEVKKYDASNGKYEVEDIDEEQKEHYVISRKKLIPLPYFRAHPQLNPDALFDVNAVVWALYPQTTCFYKGVIERRPSGPNDQYLVAFEDNSYPSGYSPPLGVPQRYVIAEY